MAKKNKQIRTKAWREKVRVPIESNRSEQVPKAVAVFCEKALDGVATLFGKAGEKEKAVRIEINPDLVRIVGGPDENREENLVTYTLAADLRVKVEGQPKDSNPKVLYRKEPWPEPPKKKGAANG